MKVANLRQEAGVAISNDQDAFIAAVCSSAELDPSEDGI
jgi:hypothetical protein